MMSIIFSSFDHQKTLLKQGINLEGENENLTQKLSEIMSSAMYVYYDYVDGLQIKKDTAILNDVTL